MRVLLALSLMFLIPTAAVQADVCVKQHSHTDGYYNGGVDYPPEDEDSETWIGDGKMAVIGARRTVIIDSADSLMFFVNHTDSSYVEIALPMDWVSAGGEQLAARVMSFQRHGDIKETGESKKIGEWHCKGYEIASHIVYQGNNYYETESLVWVTSDLPVDLDAYAAMANQIGMLRNYHVDFIEKLGKIRGVQLGSETVNYRKGFSFNASEELLEAYEGDPPDGVYSVPEGYTKKEHVTMQDLQG
jgi:hypothetical protein